MKKPSRPVARLGPTFDLAAQPAHLPVFVRIARAVSEAVQRGRLAAGAALPGSRTLADSLKVHRNTVLAAYRELEAEGFIETERGRGTFVARTLPTAARSQRPAAKSAAKGASHPLGYAFSVPAAAAPAFVSPPRDALMLYGGQPDTTLVPRAAYARAYRRAVNNTRDDLLGYGSPYGDPALRASLATMLREQRGLVVTPDDVLITRGSQMALWLVGQVLTAPGDVVAVEAFGYPPAFRALTQRGALLAPIPVDAEGLCLDALRALCAARPVRAVYVTPHHQYPTTVAMSAARRMGLLQLAAEQRFAIIEDDYDHEFHYDGRPVLPLASADTRASVLYIGTLSKVLAPALRVGFLVAPPAVLAAAAAVRFDFDRQGDRLGERALAELIDDGELKRHLLRARGVYWARRDHAVQVLQQRLGADVDFVIPRGGMSLWVKLHRSLSPAAVVRAAAADHGVHVQLGNLFAAAGNTTPHVRIGYGAVSEADFSRAVRSLQAVFAAVRR